MYQIKVNGKYQFDVESTKDQFKVNDVPVVVDSATLSDGHLHVLYQHKSYNVELIDEQADDKTVTVKVNGRIYQVEIKDQYDQLLQQLGLDNLSAHKVLETKAPMPGMVLNVLVQVGQEVQKGDNLLVLEAMKMENMIKAAAQGVVKAVLVQQGDKVEKNAILIQFA